ncbi:hypothetical protein [Mucilaginibacter aquaedulcis]|uniref:hypothetical protein n=1 Tax=Mucilaginibacter aquaedulcis TaxID=1187081 RepID=UPI0025B3898E|nr:hypothetical protein [Mucilaginibacter aquaedulcis]MDN3551153.1 hypothetical protein [Mucilaginibacter aquaedulcis]
MELKEFDLPLPNVFVERVDYIAFLFTDEKEYFGYRETLCDLIDNLFYEAIKTEFIRNKLICLTTLVSLFKE